MNPTPHDIPDSPAFLTARIFSALLLGGELIIWLALAGLQHVEHRVDTETLVGFGWIGVQFIVTIIFFYRKPWAALALGAMNIPALLFLGWGMAGGVPAIFIVSAVLFGVMIYYMVTLWKCFSSSKKSPATVIGFEPILKPKGDEQS